MISSPVSCSEFFGRREELEFLAARFRGAVNGSGGVVFVIGEAGIGKSRLISEFRKQLTHPGVTFATGRCSEGASAPYTPFKEMFEQPLPVPAVSARMVLVAGATDKTADFDFITRQLRHKAAGRPLVITVEDVQWADTSSFELLEHVQRELAASNVLIILSARQELATHEHPGWQLMTRMVRAGASIIKLRRMLDSEMRLLAYDVLNGRRLPTGRLDLVIELAEGNPLFAEELIRSEFDKKFGQEDDVELQALSVQDIVFGRFKQLDLQEQRTLIHASVIGRYFDASFLAKIMGLPVSKILPALRKARNAHLIGENKTTLGRFGFRHPLTREILSQQLLAIEAVELHATIARALEQQPEADRNVRELAYHWSTAGQPAKAAHYNEMAGDAAFAISAYSDAARYYRRAFDFESAAGERRARLCEKLAYSLYVGGSSDDTREWFNRAIDEYGGLGSTEKMAQMLLYIARQCWNDADTQAGFPMAVRALELLQAGRESRLKAYAQVMMATYCAVLGKPREALRHLAAPRSLSSPTKPEIAGRFFDSQAMAFASLGKVNEALASFKQAVKMARRADDGDLIVRVVTNFGNYALWLGDSALATDCWSQALCAAQERRLAGRIAYTSLGFAWTLMWLGQLDRARSLVDLAFSTGVDNPCVRILKASVGIPLGLMLRDRGLTQRCAEGDAIELAFRSTEAQRIGPAASAFVDLWNTQGRTDDARSLLHRAVVALGSADHSWWLSIQTAMYAEPIYCTRARGVLAKASHNAAHVVARAHLKLFDALIEQRNGHPEQTLLHAREAAEMFARLGWPLCEAKARETAEDFSASLAICQRIGDGRNQERLEALLAPRHRRGRSGTTLTPREWEVVQHVSAGKSNREIAAELAISERTVEHHLESIFNRLGIRSRAQLIALGVGGVAPWVQTPMRKPGV